ncbi:MAG: tRNA(Ile)-lysidine synthetase, partial [Burkholderiales bacterium]|nr:tRNA(Ile)-lysidine synthetase [Burkholderiales bacterium]
MAVSGGRDSLALWHAAARTARELGGIDVVGLHVHHGLQPQADAWPRQLQQR